MAICVFHVERFLPPKSRVERYSFKYFDKLALSTEAKQIGDLIRQHRLRCGITQVGLAKLLDVSVWTISEWEAGRLRPRRHKQQIASWLGVSVANLFSVMPDKRRPD